MIGSVRIAKKNIAFSGRHSIDPMVIFYRYRFAAYVYPKCACCTNVDADVLNFVVWNDPPAF